MCTMQAYTTSPGNKHCPWPRPAPFRSGLSATEAPGGCMHSRVAAIGADSLRLHFISQMYHRGLAGEPNPAARTPLARVCRVCHPSLPHPEANACTHACRPSIPEPVRPPTSTPSRFLCSPPAHAQRHASTPLTTRLAKAAKTAAVLPPDTRMLPMHIGELHIWAVRSGRTPTDGVAHLSRPCRTQRAAMNTCLMPTSYNAAAGPSVSGHCGGRGSVLCVLCAGPAVGGVTAARCH